MNRKEVSEIKKQLTPANCNITTICGCYVNEDKEKKGRMKEAFFSLQEEESFKYFDIFKKALSGQIGKTLLNMDFPLESEKDGGPHAELLKLRDTKLMDYEILEAFYDKVIANYKTDGCYLILLIHSMYDIPGKAKDETEMFDASDEVYSYIQCCICPVKLDKPGLRYNTAEDIVEDRIRDRLVGLPDTGFLFPAFNDRSTDIHSLLFYSRKADRDQEAFAEELLGCRLPMAAGEQKETFASFVESALGDNCSFEVVKGIYEKLNEKVEERESDATPYELNPKDMEDLLEGELEEQEVKDVATGFELLLKESPIIASNVIDKKKMVIKTDGVSIQVETEKTQVVKTKIIDGKKYLVVPVEGYLAVNEVNTDPVAK